MIRSNQLAAVLDSRPDASTQPSPPPPPSAPVLAATVTAASLPLCPPLPPQTLANTGPHRPAGSSTGLQRSLP